MTVTRHHNRISGPVVDRIDTHVEVPRVDYDKLSGSRLSEPSSNIRGRVEKASRMQQGASTKVGRTIVDVAGSERIQTAHLAEAIQYLQRNV